MLRKIVNIEQGIQLLFVLRMKKGLLSWRLERKMLLIIFNKQLLQKMVSLTICERKVTHLPTQFSQEDQYK